MDDGPCRCASAFSRALWFDASVTVVRRLLADDDPDPFAVIAEGCRDAARAHLVTVLVPEHGRRTLVVRATAGPEAPAVADSERQTARDVSRHVLRTGEALRMESPCGRMSSDASSWPPARQFGDPSSAPLRTTEEPPPGAVVGPMLILPLGNGTDVHGVLVIARQPGHDAYTADELEMAASFARLATAGVDLSASHRQRRETALLEQREMIGGELQDRIIYRLFAAGLTLYSVAGQGDLHAARTITGVAADLDEVIRQARHAVFRSDSGVPMAVAST